jgi:hypothetical protein
MADFKVYQQKRKMPKMGISDEIIDLSIGLIVLVFVGAFAITEYMAVNTSTWDATTILMWGLVIVFFILAVGLLFVRYVRNAKN